MDLSIVEWRKASRSTSNGGECVEIASVPEAIAIRDTKDPNGPRIFVSRKDFRKFTESLRRLGL